MVADKEHERKQCAVHFWLVISSTYNGKAATTISTTVVLDPSIYFML